MNDIILGIIILGVWLFINRLLLPKMGVPT